MEIHFDSDENSTFSNWISISSDSIDSRLRSLSNPSRSHLFAKAMRITPKRFWQRRKFANFTQTISRRRNSQKKARAKISWFLIDGRRDFLLNFALKGSSVEWDCWMLLVLILWIFAEKNTRSTTLQKVAAISIFPLSKATRSSTFSLSFCECLLEFSNNGRWIPVTFTIRFAERPNMKDGYF